MATFGSDKPASLDVSLVPCLVRSNVSGVQPQAAWYLGLLIGDDGAVTALVRIGGELLLRSVSLSRVHLIETIPYTDGNPEGPPPNIGRSPSETIPPVFATQSPKAG